MRYRIDTDPFEQKQPPIEFEGLLSEAVHKSAPVVWNQRTAEPDEIYIPFAHLYPQFVDPELLETAYDDFRNFMQVNGITEGKYAFITMQDDTLPEEAYRISVSKDRCLIASADTEGIRRALIYIEDEMLRREGCFLPIGEVYRYAVVKRRISRGFFNSHYEQPGCTGELDDETEYYTDNYLNRLAHDGVNALWVQERLRVIIPSSIIPEYGKDGKKRIERLNQLIARCKRYGIKVYLEGIEPASSYNNPDLLQHPELLGQQFGADFYAFCTSTEEGKAYIRESITKLFEAVPDLGGLINISVGEAVSCCASVETSELECPKCKALGLSRAQVLANCEMEIANAMHQINPDAELISWSYSIRSWNDADRTEYFNMKRSDVVSMVNFEDAGKVVQLGKEHTAIDYWLSYAGPGELFKQAAEAGVQPDTPIYAKLQVCASHEIGTVPYIPVPGILYDKYKYMHQHGVSGVMYCWYHGNYPSIMNKAAGELAFGPFFHNKNEFLKHLAGIYWGKQADKAMQAYNLFEEGHVNYPISLSFKWHGPIGDAPAWPLHLEPVDLPGARTYKLMNMVGSDRLGDAMLMGHTYQDTLQLCTLMSEKWSRGAEIFMQLNHNDEYAKVEQQSVAKALDILFASGANVLKFYDLRNSLALFGENKADILDRMRELVFLEIEHSRKLIKLCYEDKRLGYHSEAMGFKYFPEKLKWRIDMLYELLENEFPLVEKRIQNNMLPLPFYFGLDEESHRYVTEATEIQNAGWENMLPQEGNMTDAQIRMAETQEAFILQLKKSDTGNIVIKPEFELFHPYVTVCISPEGKVAFRSAGSYGLSLQEAKEEMQKWQVKTEREENKFIYTVTLYKKDFFDSETIPPFRLAVSVEGENRADWEPGDRFYQRLILGRFSPDSYVFIVPKRLADKR